MVETKRIKPTSEICASLEMRNDRTGEVQRAEIIATGVVKFTAEMDQLGLRFRSE